MAVLNPPKAPAAQDPRAAVEKALGNPQGADLPSISKVSKINIIVDDATRVTPTKLLLSVILPKLQNLGARQDQISISIANGLHEISDQQTVSNLLGDDVATSYRVVNNNGSDTSVFADFGKTGRGTPVEVNEHVTDCDLRILTGIVEPHQLAGYSGGVKAMIPGVSSEKTITANHSLMLNENVRVGKVEGNSLREDLEEAAALTHGSGQNFIVNTVVNEDREIVHVVAGDEIQAHRKAVALSREISSVSVQEKADVVIASPGGYPRDLNLYQSQKALAHIEGIIKKNGVAVLLAECRNGTGSKTCEEWMTRGAQPADIIRRLKTEGFNMGAHKAYQLARFMVKANIVLVSNLPRELVESMHLHTAANLEDAYREALDIVGSDARVVVCPYAAATLPDLSPQR